MFLVHKIVRIVASRPLTTSTSLLKAPSEPTPPPTNDISGSSAAGGTTSGSGGGDKKNTLTCPKCGDPCTHVETFVCKFFKVIGTFNPYYCFDCIVIQRKYIYLNKQ